MRKPSRGEAHVAHKFTVGEKIGEGSFGDIYKGTNIATNEPVALKFVVFDHKLQESMAKGFSLLFHEAKIYNELAGARRFGAQV